MAIFTDNLGNWKTHLGDNGNLRFDGFNTDERCLCRLIVNSPVPFSKEVMLWGHPSVVFPLSQEEIASIGLGKHEYWVKLFSKRGIDTLIPDLSKTDHTHIEVLP